jgi:hypothetical protein
MNKLRVITIIFFIFQIITFLLSFLAHIDIGHDFLGSRLVISEVLPEWTKCRSEWLIVQIDFLVRTLFIFIAVLDVCSKKANKKLV